MMDYANNEINCKRIPNHDVDVFWSHRLMPLLSSGVARHIVVLLGV